MRTAVIVTGGPGGADSTGFEPPDVGSTADPAILGDPAIVGDDVVVIAADGGLHRADSAGLTVDVVIGDMDSVDPERLERAVASGVRVERHPEDKDATDLELALDLASARGVGRIVVLASPAGRLDHLLGGLLVLTREAYAHLEIDALVGSTRVLVVRGRRRLRGRPGQLVSLLPVGGPARGVTTEDLAWPLVGETLEVGTTRGVSNRFVSSEAAVSLDDGCLLVMIEMEEAA
ncbi:MAG: thiamine diphosphokinase [Acidimicrobiales bacterium]